MDRGESRTEDTFRRKYRPLDTKEEIELKFRKAKLFCFVLKSYLNVTTRAYICLHNAHVYVSLDKYSLLDKEVGTVPEGGGGGDN